MKSDIICNFGLYLNDFNKIPKTTLLTYFVKKHIMEIRKLGNCK